MESLSYHNLLDFLQGMPAGDSDIYYEEGGYYVPESWKQLGTLYDEKIKLHMEVYKQVKNYSLGFYPFNGCDIYQDEKNRILLSYVEFGGHLPFRVSYIVTKNSPFIFEPVGFSLIIAESEMEIFESYMLLNGLSSELMESDLAAYRNIAYFNDDFSKERVTVIRRYFDSVKREFNFTLVASREQAHAISGTFNKKPA